MHPGDPQRPVTRRSLLSGLAGGTAAAGLALAGTSPTVAASPTDLTSWFENTGNAGTVTDRTGQDSVTVDVGTDGNGAGFGFGPAVVRVDPGTTVVWNWTGKGGRHNVVADDGSFESSFYETAGATFEHTFESPGVRQYLCRPHEPMGMKGAILVGDVAVTLSGSGGGTATQTGDDSDGSQGTTGVDPNYGDWFRNVPNFESTVDATGQEEVRIAVGETTATGQAVFDPPAVHVDPETTVVWEWAGDGGRYTVTSDDPEFRSQTTGESGATYALSFGGSGVVKYACEQHRSAGMKGAIVVGEPEVSTAVNLLETAVWGLIGTIIATPFVIGHALSRRHDAEEPGGPRERGP